jgi:hypothetical protein
MTTSILAVIAVVCFVLYMQRRRSRLNAEE